MFLYKVAMIQKHAVILSTVTCWSLLLLFSPIGFYEIFYYNNEQILNDTYVDDFCTAQQW